MAHTTRQSEDAVHSFYQHPILNNPYEYPNRHWQLDQAGRPTSRIVEARRSAKFVTPIPRPKAAQDVASQPDLGLEADDSGQAYDLTSIINRVRGSVDRWRLLPTVVASALVLAFVMGGCASSSLSARGDVGLSDAPMRDEPSPSIADDPEEPPSSGQAMGDPPPNAVPTIRRAGGASTSRSRISNTVAMEADLLAAVLRAADEAEAAEEQARWIEQMQRQLDRIAASLPTPDSWEQVDRHHDPFEMVTYVRSLRDVSVQTADEWVAIELVIRSADDGGKLDLDVYATFRGCHPLEYDRIIVIADDGSRLVVSIDGDEKRVCALGGGLIAEASATTLGDEGRRQALAIACSHSIRARLYGNRQVEFSFTVAQELSWKEIASVYLEHELRSIM